MVIGNSGTLNLNGNSQTIASLAGGGNVSLGAGAGGTLTTGGSNASTTYSGVISGTGGLAKAGSGTFTVTGVNVTPARPRSTPVCSRSGPAGR